MFQKGHKHSVDSIKRMIETRRKRGVLKHSDETKNKLSLIAKGRVFSPQTRRKMSIAKQGERNWKWRGGITKIYKKIRSSVEYKLWREAVLRRDKNSCIWCGHRENLHADHIKPFAFFPELRFAIDNGRTLCWECHKTTNSYGCPPKQKNCQPD